MVMQYKWIAVLHEMFDKVNFYICFFIRCLCHTLCYPLKAIPLFRQIATGPLSFKSGFPFLFALRFTQIGQIPTGDSGNCG